MSSSKCQFTPVTPPRRAAGSCSLWAQARLTRSAISPCPVGLHPAGRRYSPGPAHLPDRSFGGYNRFYDAPEMVRTCAPCYFKIEPGPACAAGPGALYKPWVDPQLLANLGARKGQARPNHPRAGPGEFPCGDAFVARARPTWRYPNPRSGHRPRQACCRMFESRVPNWL